MGSGGLGAARGDVFRLFDGGSVAGLGDGELLDRFADGRDEAAFEGLVARLGPMVLGVCRRMLSDPHDVDDAFQATFLVLVRRAGSIRDRDLVGPWLYGVATRVARRARAESSRRAAFERVAVVPEAVEVEPGWPELRALIDEEIDRLPEHHRRAVVLCDVEGLSREEAAIRLGWTLNMVRGRLERARGRLRGQLARRGLAPSGAWAALMVSPPSPPPALVASTIRAALAFSAGRLGAGLATASAVALSRGVLRMMMFSKLKVGLAIFLSAGFVAGGTGMLAAQGPGAGANAPPSKPVAVEPAAQKVSDPTAVSDPFRPRPAADLAKARIDAAKQRYQAQRAFYEAGQFTNDRVVDASRRLMQVELESADSKAARVEAVRAHYARLKKILDREKADLAAGATTADIADVERDLLDTEYALTQELEAPEAKPARKEAKAQTQPGKDRFEIARRLLAAEKKGAEPAEGVALTPGGPIPVPVAGASGSPKVANRSPLAEAVDAFNRNAMNIEIGRDQPPLTEDEVIAAIRYHADDGTGFIKGALDDFRMVSETRDMPPGMRFENRQMNDMDGDFVFEGWWVQIVMSKAGGGDSVIPIRSRVLRSLPLEEAIKWAHAKQVRAMQSANPEERKTAFLLREYIKSLEQRIGRKGK